MSEHPRDRQEDGSDGALPAMDYARLLAHEIAGVAPAALIGVYVHGSAVLGDWRPRTSDIDLIVVVGDACPRETLEELREVLVADRRCPGSGLEVSVVGAAAAALPAAPWPFLVHATTLPSDRKVVWGHSRPGDPDLVLHYLVTREHGWAAAGPAARDVVGEVPPDVVVGRLADELRWAVLHASRSYAVLNACRALRYRDERIICSKTDAGLWAVSRGLRSDLVEEALEQRRHGLSEPITKRSEDWVLEVANSLT